MNSLAKKWHSEPQSSHSDFQTNPQTTQMTTHPSGDFELVCVIVNVQPQSKLIFRLLIMILPWSINVFITLDQKVLQFLFRQDAFPACRLPADNKPGWFVALSCSTSHNKKSPGLSPSAFLQHCWGTRRCCSLPEGQAMLWMDYQSRNTLRYVFKYQEEEQEETLQSEFQWHRAGASPGFHAELQLGSAHCRPWLAHSDTGVTEPWLSPLLEEQRRWRELPRLLLG